MNRKCDCPEWMNNIDIISCMLIHATIHGYPYTGIPFVYCPWCGKRLVEEIFLKDPESGSSVRA